MRHPRLFAWSSTIRNPSTRMCFSSSGTTPRGEISALLRIVYQTYFSLRAVSNRVRQHLYFRQNGTTLGVCPNYWIKPARPCKVAPCETYSRYESPHPSYPAVSVFVFRRHGAGL